MQRQDVTEQAALLRPAEAWLNYFVDRFISFPNSITCPHADRIHTAAMDSEEASATKLVARMFLEQLQQSGQRDHIKEWLFRELESSGWTALLIEQARDVVLPKLLEGANKPIDQDMNATSRSHPKTKIISTAELAHSLSLFGREKIPDSVRARLLQELIIHTRNFVSSEACVLDAEEAEMNS